MVTNSENVFSTKEDIQGKCASQTVKCYHHPVGDTSLNKFDAMFASTTFHRNFIVIFPKNHPKTAHFLGDI